MELEKPCKRIILPGVETDYIFNEQYSIDYNDQKRMVIIIENDLEKIFEYVEPDKNLSTHSLRIYELFLRTATEFESMCRLILKANKYSKKIKDLNIHDYQKLNKLLVLHKYKCSIPHLKNTSFEPFKEWNSSKVLSLSWYADYNKVKHNRTEFFELANLRNLILAVAAIRILLFAQFGNHSLSHSISFEGFSFKHTGDLEEYDRDYILTNSIFQIKRPLSNDYTYSYNFDWNIIKNDKEPFDLFDFD